jgi:hypothetical protein
LDLCWDDSDWLRELDQVLRCTLEEVEFDLADALLAATVRASHATRVPDAGVYFREGLKRNDPARLESLARQIVVEEDELAWMRPRIDQMVSEFDARDRDTGRLYVCADDRPSLGDCGHYALYGSEWTLCLLGCSAHAVLRRRGVPTVLEIDLPLWAVHSEARESFAQTLLQEWIRIQVNAPNWVPELDFTFFQAKDIPAEWIVGHYHPAVVQDPLYGGIRRRTQATSCPHCSADIHPGRLVK